jgi:hypothetical protein
MLQPQLAPHRFIRLLQAHVSHLALDALQPHDQLVKLLQLLFLACACCCGESCKRLAGIIQVGLALLGCAPEGFKWHAQQRCIHYVPVISA